MRLFSVCSPSIYFPSCFCFHFDLNFSVVQRRFFQQRIRPKLPRVSFDQTTQFTSQFSPTTKCGSASWQTCRENSEDSVEEQCLGITIHSDRDGENSQKPATLLAPAICALTYVRSSCSWNHCILDTAWDLTEDSDVLEDFTLFLFPFCAIRRQFAVRSVPHCHLESFMLVSNLSCFPENANIPLTNSISDFLLMFCPWNQYASSSGP